MNHEPTIPATQPSGPATTPWLKACASTSAQGYVQVRSPSEGMIEVSDTKNPKGPTLTVLTPTGSTSWTKP